MYKEIIPKKWASQYIDAYWIQSNNRKHKVNRTILPDGCTDIILSFNNQDEKIVVGCMTKPNKVYIEPSELMFGIRFKTGCAAPFLNISIKELTDKKYSLSEIRNLNINFITPRVIEDKIFLISDLVEKYLKKIFLENKFDKTASFAAHVIKQHRGFKSIDDIANSIGISRRHLERKFMDFVGIPPKLYSRIIRFHYAHSMLLAQKNDSLIEMALDAGYYDQAHFCREYKEFSGITPSKKTDMSHFYNTSL
jgi:AraC-like DNA-binding protein